MLELCDLPTELQHQIVLNLHPAAAVALKQTNRWFHDHVSLHRLDRVAVQKYLHHLELRPRHRHDYACFYCLCLKPNTAFASTQVGRKHDELGRYNLHRHCLECGIREGKLKPFTSLTIGDDESKEVVFCGACSSVQAYFCGSCNCCSGCLAKTRTWIGRAALGHLAVGGRLCQQHFR